MSQKRKLDAATTTATAAADVSSNSPAAKKKQGAVAATASSSAAATVDEILSHRLTLLAKKTWPDASSSSSFDAALVKRIYNEDLLEADATLNGDFAATGEPEGANGALGNGSSTILELSHYLENYLWPHFSSKKDSSSSSVEHILSIIIMINEKSKENLVGCFGKAKTKNFSNFCFFLCHVFFSIFFTLIMC